jgi:hypothetical protein
MPDAKSRDPAVAENGDKRNRDNDGDGRKEPVYVEGLFRSGKYIKGQYRALPRKK